MAYVSVAAAIVAVTPAIACDKVDYAEAKAWSTAKLQRAYRDTVQEQYDSLRLELDKVAPQDRQDAATCRDQLALYRRLLEARDEDQFSCRSAK